MAKLYKMENVYKREILKRKNKQNMPRSCGKITIVAKDKKKIENKDNSNTTINKNENIIKISKK